MRVLTLKRIAENKDSTFGVLLEGQEPICNTVELPWRNNQHDISCIPPGPKPGDFAEYMMEFPWKHRDYDTWRLKDVPNRQGVLIHKGNTTGVTPGGIIQTEGCILVGQSFDYVIDRRGVADSNTAFIKLSKWLSGETQIKLIIQKA